MPKVALAMIIKGTPEEVPQLDRLLKTISPFIDATYITITGDTQDALPICQKYQAKVSYFKPQFEIKKEVIDWLFKELGYPPHVKEGEKLFVFDDARNFAFNQVAPEIDWVMWLDCDDVFRGGDKIKKLCALADENKADVIFLKYLYQVETNTLGEVTKVITEHFRERIIKNGLGKWKGFVHETLSSDNKQLLAFTNDQCDVVHLAEIGSRLQSLERNIKACEAGFYRSNGKDTRLLYYLGKLFYDIRSDQYDQWAQQLMLRFLWGEGKSEWASERAQAFSYIAEIYWRHKDWDQAEKSLMNALMDDPENPDIYLNLANTYMGKQEWPKALFWLKLMDSVPENPTLLVKSPREREAKILEISYNCNYNLGKFKEVREVAKRINEVYPNDPILQKSFENINALTNIT